MGMSLNLALATWSVITPSLRVLPVTPTLASELLLYNHDPAGNEGVHMYIIGTGINICRVEFEGQPPGEPPSLKMTAMRMAAAMVPTALVPSAHTSMGC